MARNPNETGKKFFIPIPDFYDPLKAAYSSIVWNVEQETFDEPYWMGNTLFKRTYLLPSGQFKCSYARLGIRENGVFVDRCHHDSDVTVDDEYILSTTPIELLKPGKTYYLHATTFTDGTPYEEGNDITWTTPVETNRKIIEYHGVPIIQITFSSISCSIYEVNQTYNYTTINNCMQTFSHNEFEPKDSFLELYRNSGTLKFVGTIESRKVKNKEDIQIKGSCMSNDGMREVKKVNRADICK